VAKTVTGTSQAVRCLPGRLVDKASKNVHTTTPVVSETVLTMSEANQGTVFKPGQPDEDDLSIQFWAGV